MNRLLVSVLTPTWKRHDLLMEMVENVYAQCYRPLELVIVADGPDRELMEMIDSLQPPEGVSVYAVALGRHWSSVLLNSYAAAPLTVAMFLARGDLNMWLADDERMDPHHITMLVAALEETNADFAYSRARIYHVGQSPEDGYDIGSDPPQCGQITNVLYRADILKRGLYVFGDDRTSDWSTIAQWMAAGASWAYVDRVSLTHRADR